MISNGKNFTVILGFVLVSLAIAFTSPAGARTEGEVDTELWLSSGDSFFGGESVTNFRVDHLRGNLTDYPNMLTQALYWPNTNNTLFDTGLALSGDLEIPLVGGDSSELGDMSLLLDGYFAEDFGPDYPIGTAGGSSRISFDKEQLDFWVTKGIVNYGGFSYRAVFLLEDIKESSPSILRGISNQVIFGTEDDISTEARAELKKVQTGKLSFKDISPLTLREILEAIPRETLEKELGVSSNYGSGLQLAVSGMKISGVSLELKTRLGMVPNPGEMVGEDPGSGYDVFNSEGRYGGYTGSEVEINGIEAGPVRFDTTSRFTAENGYEETAVEFSLEEESLGFVLDGTMTYSSDKKTLSLEPSLDLEWACFDVYTEIKPGELTEEKNEITGLNLKGYGMNELQIGNVKVSFLETIGDTKLQRRIGEADWRLRATDYELSSDTEFSYEGRSFIYNKTDYDGVLSLEGGGGNLEVAVDIYWEDEGNSLFGISELAGEGSYRISESFELTNGLVFSLDGLKKVIVNTVYSW
ncbi:hypothetical protein KGY72_07620 [Candidatus Bipolaricaulota bacterium]|nr:hypothetical protein [Candidatus Bipolaricaulota bacterium]